MRLIAANGRTGRWFTLGVLGVWLFGAAAVVVGRGTFAFAVIAGVVCVAICVTRNWRAVPAFLPIVLFAPNALLSVPSFFSIAIGGSALVLALVGIGWRSQRRTTPTALIPPLLLAAFGLVTSSGLVAQHAAGLLFAWVAGSAIGSLLALDIDQITPVLWVLMPTALLNVAQSVGIPDFWASLTRETAFSTGESVGAGLQRAFGPYGHPVAAGAFLGSLTLLTLSVRPRYHRLITTVYAAGTLAAFSRSSVIGLAAGVAVLVLLAPSHLRVRLVVATVVATSIVIVGVSVASPVSRALASRVNQNDNAGRVASLSIAEKSIEHDLGSVVFGHGLNGAEEYFAALGGEYLTGSTTGTLVDDEYVTSLYDFGLVPLVGFLCIVVWIVVRADPLARRHFLPALVALGVTFLFFDGLQWSSTGFIFFLLIGALATRADPPAAMREDTMEPLDSLTAA